MRFPQPLSGGRLIRRYKRFLADVRLDAGGEAQAHVPNPGAMLGLCDPGLRVWLSRSDRPGRKLPYSLELVEAPSPTGATALVGVNTQTPNRLVAEALAEGRIPELSAHGLVEAERALGPGLRPDFRIGGPVGAPLWLEVKNCHFSRTPRLAEFPDCVAARSARHARALAAEVRGGGRAAFLFVVQRDDCEVFTPAADLDPQFATALGEAAAAGVEVLAFACELSGEGVRLGARMPVRLAG